MKKYGSLILEMKIVTQKKFHERIKNVTFQKSMFDDRTKFFLLLVRSD